MCRFVESIKLKDGVFYRLKFHQERVNRTFGFYYPQEEPVNLFQTLNQVVIPQKGVYKCRIVYNDNVQQLEFIPYTLRTINSLRLVDTEIDSRIFKLEDRTEYNAAFALRGECDDVLLVKDGLLTDSSYSNIALFDGVEWQTPRTPLLYGTNRAELIQNGLLTEKDIKSNDLKNFKQICLFNAMIEFGELVLDVELIKNKE